ncbi:Rrf2 family transcriptional regulator [Candidatus Pseudoscillospira sp. SGI.172]|uniref:RrF2 family transcriptional regulator n=1 Tax=Candidatus Pseudoscillospira sp. SGI.172 TaxID=3420582 RepID=UPI0009BC2FD8|nr:Rrf2 family transcriptional regulator [Pseudoflavonifractor sp.]MDY3019157.1 Rrf2 family transcriptional regulator [Oscillospiraceae bacterium]
MDSSFNVAVHALVYLHHKDCLLSSEALAENICTNPARVRKVMAALRRAGLVDSREGNVGGYRFSGNPDRITLGQVAKALDIRFVDAAWRSGDSDMECLVASGMADVMDGLYAELDELCRERLQNVTVGDVERKIFRV